MHFLALRRAGLALLSVSVFVGYVALVNLAVTGVA